MKMLAQFCTQYSELITQIRWNQMEIKMYKDKTQTPLKVAITKDNNTYRTKYTSISIFNTCWWWLAACGKTLLTVSTFFNDHTRQRGQAPILGELSKVCTCGRRLATGKKTINCTSKLPNKRFLELDAMSC